MNKNFKKIAKSILQLLGDDAKVVIAARGSRCPQRPKYINPAKKNSDWDIAISIDTDKPIKFMDSDFDIEIAKMSGVERVDIQWSKPVFDNNQNKFVLAPFDYFWKKNIILHQRWDKCQPHSN